MRLPPLTGKNVVVIGGSRGIGRRIVECCARDGARVLAVARQEASLRRLVEEVSGAEALALDAAEESAPFKVFDMLQPDVLVLGAGVCPPGRYTNRAGGSSPSTGRPTSKSHFSSARRRYCASACGSFGHFDRQLRRSGWISAYRGICRSQTNADAHRELLSEGIRSSGARLLFVTLAPRIIPDSELGKQAVACYSRYLGMSAADFIQAMASPPAPSGVATAVIELAANPEQFKGKVFIVSGKGLEAAPLC
jgi:hypothetical protein